MKEKTIKELFATDFAALGWKDRIRVMDYCIVTRKVYQSRHGIPHKEVDAFSDDDEDEQYVCDDYVDELGSSGGWPRDVLRDAHGSYLPNDYSYRICRQVVDCLLDHADYVEEAVSGLDSSYVEEEFVRLAFDRDSWSDPYISVYNLVLAKYSASNVYRFASVDEKLQELVENGVTENLLTSAIQLAWTEEWEETARALMQSLFEDLPQEEEEEEEETETQENDGL